MANGTTPAGDRVLDTLVVGAGPAGLGVGLALLAVDEVVFGVLERGRVGESFHRWPSRTRFLTPSFPGNAFGALDLNAVHPETSPAHTLKVDYPSGQGYAHYLRKVQEHFRVPVRERCGVYSVEPLPGGGFTVLTSDGPVHSKTVVWAAGNSATHANRLFPEPSWGCIPLVPRRGRPPPKVRWWSLADTSPVWMCPVLWSRTDTGSRLSIPEHRGRPAAPIPH